jgi:hypothetical protein
MVLSVAGRHMFLQFISLSICGLYITSHIRQCQQLYQAVVDLIQVVPIKIVVSGTQLILSFKQRETSCEHLECSATGNAPERCARILALWKGREGASYSINYLFPKIKFFAATLVNLLLLTLLRLSSVTISCKRRPARSQKGIILKRCYK